MLYIYICIYIHLSSTYITLRIYDSSYMYICNTFDEYIINGVLARYCGIAKYEYSCPLDPNLSLYY